MTRNAIAASVVMLTLSFVPACTRTEAIEKIPAGTEVTVETADGTLVRGKIAKVEPDLVTLTSDRPDATTEISRTSIAEVKRVAADSAPAAVVRTLTVPDNTVLDVTLGTTLASDSSRIEERVQGSVASPVVIDGILFETDYLRLPDEYTVADDVLLEARHGDTEIDMTHAEFEGAIGLGEGVFRLRSGSLVRFLSSAVIH